MACCASRLALRTDTLLLFTPDALHVVASPKKGARALRCHSSQPSTRADASPLRRLAEILRPVVAPAKAEANIDVVVRALLGDGMRQRL